MKLHYILAVGAAVAICVTTALAGGSAQWNGRGWTYRDQYGMPQGSSEWNGYNGYQFRDQYGMPQGSATWDGRQWHFRDQYGQ